MDELEALLRREQPHLGYVTFCMVNGQFMATLNSTGKGVTSGHGATPLTAMNDMVARIPRPKKLPGMK